MENLEKNNQTTEKKSVKRGKKLIFKIILIALIVCICALVYTMAGCRKNVADDIYSFAGDSNYQISEYNGKILTVSYDGIKLLDFNGKQVGEAENHMSSPHYKVDGSLILMYDKGDKKLAVYDGITKKYTYESEYPIKTAKINKKGYVVLISDEVAYNAKVTVLDDKGEVAYIWKIGNEYIVDADISPDNKKIVAATITTETGVIEENVVFVDIKAAEEIGRVKNVGDMPLSVEFVESGSALVVSDSKLCAYDAKAKKKWTKSFENNILQSFEIDESGNTVVALKGIKNNTVVITYTKNGSKAGEYTTQTKATCVDVNGKNIAVCEKSTVSVINYSGKVLSSSEIKKEVLDISVVGDNKVLLLCEDRIQFLKL